MDAAGVIQDHAVSMPHQNPHLAANHSPSSISATQCRRSVSEVENMCSTSANLSKRPL